MKPRKWSVWILLTAVMFSYLTLGAVVCQFTGGDGYSTGSDGHAGHSH